MVSKKRDCPEHSEKRPAPWEHFGETLGSWDPTELPWGYQKSQYALGSHLAEIRKGGEFGTETVSGDGGMVNHLLCNVAYNNR